MKDNSERMPWPPEYFGVRVENSSPLAEAEFLNAPPIVIDRGPHRATIHLPADAWRNLRRGDLVPASGEKTWA